MIIRNAARCKNCGDTIESKYRHDFQACSCYENVVGNKGIAVDGGLSYLRRVGNIDGFEELSEEDGDEALL